MKQQRAPHVLMTADAVGGVWVYASSLAQELAKRGWRVTLVTLGPAPREDQFLPLLDYPQIDLEITDLLLEWQDPEGKDRGRTLAYMESLSRRLRPDIVHANGFREACAAWRAPVVVTAHSCVGSWWRACRDAEPEERWQLYLRDVRAALAGAERWVAPSAAFRDAMRQLYETPRAGRVIANGIAMLCGGPAPKEPFVLAAGRLWDEAKNIRALSRIAGQLDWPVHIAGPLEETGGGIAPHDGDSIWHGNLPHGEMLALMQRAAIFVSPALYEPFGLTVLEAAARGCALVLSDIPVFRELWNGAALFIEPRDPQSLRAALSALTRDGARRTSLQSAAKARAARFTLAAMTGGYERLYAEMLPQRMQPKASAPSSPALEARA